MMHEINRLTEGSDGVLDPASYEQTVATLLTGGADTGDHQGADGGLDSHHQRCGKIGGAS